MKFKVTFKDPDALNDCIEDAVKEQLSSEIKDPDEIELLVDHRIEKVRDICYKWFEYGEYLVVEVDTELETCVVVAND